VAGRCYYQAVSVVDTPAPRVSEISQTAGSRRAKWLWWGRHAACILEGKQDSERPSLSGNVWSRIYAAFWNYEHMAFISDVIFLSAYIRAMFSRTFVRGGITYRVLAGGKMVKVEEA
jgi:hypothetical protein